MRESTRERRGECDEGDAASVTDVDRLGPNRRTLPKAILSYCCDELIDEQRSLWIVCCIVFVDTMNVRAMGINLSQGVMVWDSWPRLVHFESRGFCVRLLTSCRVSYISNPADFVSER